MSPYLYRRLMGEKLPQLRQHAAASLTHTHGAHGVCLRAANPVAAHEWVTGG
jgi:hypothetical protein